MESVKIIIVQPVAVDGAVGLVAVLRVNIGLFLGQRSVEAFGLATGLRSVGFDETMLIGLTEAGFE